MPSLNVLWSDHALTQVEGLEVMADLAGRRPDLEYLLNLIETYLSSLESAERLGTATSVQPADPDVRVRVWNFRSIEIVYSIHLARNCCSIRTCNPIGENWLESVRLPASPP